MALTHAYTSDARSNSSPQFVNQDADVDESKFVHEREAVKRLESVVRLITEF